MKYGIYSNLRGDNSRLTGQIQLKIKLVKDFTVIYISTTYYKDYRKNEGPRVLTRWNIAVFHNSRGDNSRLTGLICLKIKFVRDLMVINILTKFEQDWCRNEWLRVLTKWKTTFFFQFQWEITLDLLVQSGSKLNLSEILWSSVFWQSVVRIDKEMKTLEC